jgi:hypothetical protein
VVLVLVLIVDMKCIVYCNTNYPDSLNPHFCSGHYRTSTHTHIHTYTHTHIHTYTHTHIHTLSRPGHQCRSLGDRTSTRYVYLVANMFSTCMMGTYKLIEQCPLFPVLLSYTQRSSPDSAILDKPMLLAQRPLDERGDCNHHHHIHHHIHIHHIKHHHIEHQHQYQQQQQQCHAFGGGFQRSGPLFDQKQLRRHCLVVDGAAFAQSNSVFHGTFLVVARVVEDDVCVLM